MDVNKIQKFISWLSERTRSLNESKKTRINIGCLQISLEYLANSRDHKDPLRIAVHTDRSAGTVIAINHDADVQNKPDLQYIKRILHTPFYYSYSVSKTGSLKVIDFYQWQSAPVLYRIFIVQNYKPQPDFQVNCSEDISTDSLNKNLRIDKLYVKLSQPYELSNDKKCITIQMNQDTGDRAFVMAVSSDPITHDISFQAAVKILYRLEKICRENHINNNFIINYKSAEKELDALWCAQKYLLPDHAIDPVILSDPDRYEREITWIVELCCYLGLNESLLKILNTIKKSIDSKNINWRLVYTACYLENFLDLKKKDRFSGKYIKEKKDQTDNIFHTLCCACNADTEDIREDDIIYSAYFNRSVKNAVVIEYLQVWWDIISLPLFQNRLEKSITGNSEKILLVILLGLTFQLPWIPALIESVSNTDFDPFFRLIVFLFSRLSARKSIDKHEYIYCGFKWDNNVKRVIKKDNEFSYSYTRFSKNVYFAIKEKSTNILKIDHQVHCIYDYQNQETTILPAVYNMDRSVYRELPVKVDGLTLNLPLVFKKGELVFCNVRFRWIFKKKRFQFTIVNTDKDKKVFIDRHPLSLSTGIKHKHYVTIDPGFHTINTTILDKSGRSRHFSRGAMLREIRIYGWACDRFCLFARYFNYKYTRKQYLNTIESSGAINHRATIPRNIKEINIIVKRANKQFPVQFYNHLFIEKILQFSPQKRDDDFIVLIDQDLIKKIAGIQKFFEDTFAFQPDYLIKTSDMMPVQSGILLYISSVSNKIEIIEDKSISIKPFCRIGIKKGIGQLPYFYRFLKEQVSE